MTTELKLMRVGMTMEEAVIGSWFKRVGDKFSEGEPLYQIETEKVTHDVEAPFAGELVDIKVPAGEVAAVGAVVAIVLRSNG
jgi:pyruvate/2-oxoglutarate dehydrogenase complex dihydrolipoamide acyltransferase (E2) component